MSEDKLAKDISEKIKKDIDEMCLNYRLLGEIHNKDVEIREEQQQEIERLNNIINELEKWLENLCFDPLCEIGYRQSLWKLKELRGDKE